MPAILQCQLLLVNFLQRILIDTSALDRPSEIFNHPIIEQIPSILRANLHISPQVGLIFHCEGAAVINVEYLWRAGFDIIDFFSPELLIVQFFSQFPILSAYDEQEILG